MTGDWRHSAKCRDEDPELWFAPTTYAAGKVDANRAKSICAACPVRQSCEDWAIETQQGWGIWGGLDEDERRSIRRREHRRGAA